MARFQHQSDFTFNLIILSKKTIIKAVIAQTYPKQHHTFPIIFGVIHSMFSRGSYSINNNLISVIK